MEFYIFIAILVILFILLNLQLFLKIRVPHSFKYDKVIQKERDRKQQTTLYKISNFADPITASYIRRYTIVRDGGPKYCVIKYKEPLKMIRYNIFMYNGGGKLLEVLEIEERNTSNVSRDIKIKNNCKNINIKVIAIDNQKVNKQLKNVSFFKLLLYTMITFIFTTMTIYLGLSFVIGESDKEFNLTTSVGLALLYSVILLLHLMKKNRLREEF